MIINSSIYGGGSTPVEPLAEWWEVELPDALAFGILYDMVMNDGNVLYSNDQGAGLWILRKNTKSFEQLIPTGIWNTFQNILNPDTGKSGCIVTSTLSDGVYFISTNLLSEPNIINTLTTTGRGWAVKHIEQNKVAFISGYLNTEGLWAIEYATDFYKEFYGAGYNYTGYSSRGNDIYVGAQTNQTGLVRFTIGQTGNRFIQIHSTGLGWYEAYKDENHHFLTSTSATDGGILSVENRAVVWRYTVGSHWSVTEGSDGNVIFCATLFGSTKNVLLYNNTTNAIYPLTATTPYTKLIKLYNGKIIAYGGSTSAYSQYKGIAIYDPSTLLLDVRPAAFYGFAFHKVFSDCILFTSHGFNDTEIHQIWRYEIDTDELIQVSSFDNRYYTSSDKQADIFLSEDDSNVNVLYFTGNKIVEGVCICYISYNYSTSTYTPYRGIYYYNNTNKTLTTLNTTGVWENFIRIIINIDLYSIYDNEIEFISLPIQSSSGLLFYNKNILFNLTPDNSSSITSYYFELVNNILTFGGLRGYEYNVLTKSLNTTPIWTLTTLTNTNRAGRYSMAQRYIRSGPSPFRYIWEIDKVYFDGTVVNVARINYGYSSSNSYLNYSFYEDMVFIQMIRYTYAPVYETFLVKGDNVVIPINFTPPLSPTNNMYMDNKVFVTKIDNRVFLLGTDSSFTNVSSVPDVEVDLENNTYKLLSSRLLGVTAYKHLLSYNNKIYIICNGPQYMYDLTNNLMEKVPGSLTYLYGNIFTNYKFIYDISKGFVKALKGNYYYIIKSNNIYHIRSIQTNHILYGEEL